MWFLLCCSGGERGEVHPGCMSGSLSMREVSEQVVFLFVEEGMVLL